MSQKEIAQLEKRVRKLEEAQGSAHSSPDRHDLMYEQVKQVVIEAGKASTSYIQRRLRVGYSHAARLIDELEDEGIIGPSEGSKPREVFVSSNSPDELLAMKVSRAVEQYTNNDGSLDSVKTILQKISDDL